MVTSRLARKENVSIMPFHIADKDISADARYYLGRIHWIDAMTPPIEKRIDELTEKMLHVLGKNSVKTSQFSPYADSSKEETYRIVTSLVYPDTNFVGRNAELEKLEVQLHEVDNKALLVGMGGIGKSEIAKMFLKQHAMDYDVALWVPFEDSLQKTIANDDSFPIEGISRVDYPMDSDEQYAKRKFDVLKRIADRRVLIIIDNFDLRNDPNLALFCSGQYSVIFTTRYRQVSAQIHEIEVSSMSDNADLMKVFSAGYSRLIEGDDKAIIERIIRLLEGHTLSIRLVASVMQSRRIRPAKMLSLLLENNKENLRDNFKVFDQIFRRLKDVFRLSQLNKDELFILENMSLLSNKGLSVETFYQWCELDDYDVIDGLIDRSWVIYNRVQDVAHLHPLIAEIMSEELEKDYSCCSTML